MNFTSSAAKVDVDGNWAVAVDSTGTLEGEAFDGGDQAVGVRGRARPEPGVEVDLAEPPGDHDQPGRRNELPRHARLPTRTLKRRRGGEHVGGTLAQPAHACRGDGHRGVQGV